MDAAEVSLEPSATNEDDARRELVDEIVTWVARATATDPWLREHPPEFDCTDGGPGEPRTQWLGCEHRDPAPRRAAHRVQ